jgi:hypothetical protein
MMSLVAAVSVAGLIAMQAAPAAANSAGGAVTGTVSISPGVKLTPNNNNFTFAPITLAGTFAFGTKTYSGKITTSVVTGSSHGETTTKGAGHVNPFTFHSVPSSSKLSGTCQGSFTRSGSIVIVKLKCSGQLNGKPGSLPLTVVAQFSPTTGNGVTTPVTKASFAGVFV